MSSLQEAQDSDLAVTPASVLEELRPMFVSLKPNVDVFEMRASLLRMRAQALNGTATTIEINMAHESLLKFARAEPSTGSEMLDVQRSAHQAARDKELAKLIAKISAQEYSRLLNEAGWSAGRAASGRNTRGQSSRSGGGGRRLVLYDDDDSSAGPNSLGGRGGRGTRSGNGGRGGNGAARSGGGGRGCGSAGSPEPAHRS